MTRVGAARLGGSLYVISGALVLVNNYLPASDHLDRLFLGVIGGAAIALGLVTWFLIPWSSISQGWTLTLPALGLALVGLANAGGGVSPQSFSTFFILIAAYIGATQRRWTTLAFSPAIAAVYVLAQVYRDDSTPAGIWSVTVVVPVCILVGEVIAGALSDLASARARSERRAALLAVTARASRAVSALEARQVLRAVADAALDLGYEAVTLEVFEQDGEKYRCAEARGLPPGFTGKRHPADEGVTGEVRRQSRQIVIDDYDRDPRSVGELRGLGFAVVIGTPIWHDGRIVSVLNVGSRKAVEVEPSELEALELLAEQASHALEIAGHLAMARRESRRYRRESLTDDLSGLGNRRMAEQLIASARAGDTIAMIDLDAFKRLNDERGHQVGDQVLASLGGFLRSKLRGGDVAARYGGDEFVIVIRSETRDAMQVFERLRRDWRATGAPASLSMGVASVGDNETPAAALARADAALLSAKAAGGDMVSPAAPHTADPPIEPQEPALDRFTGATD